MVNLAWTHFKQPLKFNIWFDSPLSLFYVPCNFSMTNTMLSEDHLKTSNMLCNDFQYQNSCYHLLICHTLILISDQYWLNPGSAKQQVGLNFSSFHLLEETSKKRYKETTKRKAKEKSGVTLVIIHLGIYQLPMCFNQTASMLY